MTTREAPGIHAEAEPEAVPVALTIAGSDSGVGGLPETR